VDAIANDKAFNPTLALSSGHGHTNASTIVRTYMHQIFRELFLWNQRDVLVNGQSKSGRDEALCKAL
jgi:hypothetical protein